MITRGLYQHYKGDLYFVVAVIRSSGNYNTGNIVIYHPLTGHEPHLTTRPELEFEDLIRVNETRAGFELVSRFKRIALAPNKSRPQSPRHENEYVEDTERWVVLPK